MIQIYPEYTLDFSFQEKSENEKTTKEKEIETVLNQMAVQIGKSFVRKRTLVKYQSQCDPLEQKKFVYVFVMIRIVH